MPFGGQMTMFFHTYDLERHPTWLYSNSVWFCHLSGKKSENEEKCCCLVNIPSGLFLDPLLVLE